MLTERTRQPAGSIMLLTDQQAMTLCKIVPNLARAVLCSGNQDKAVNYDSILSAEAHEDCIVRGRII